MKILLVDDEPDIIEILKFNLEKEGYEVYTASNGIEALELAKKCVPSIFVLDVMMPEMDGIELCRLLRADSQFDKSLVTFLSARKEDYTQVAALGVGGDDFIAKPIKPNTFLSKIKALSRLVNRFENTQSTDIQIADLTIRVDELTVIKDEVLIDLAKKEFELLYLLVSKPGKVFRRIEILNKVWGSDVIVGGRTIDVHIRKLREKLGDDYIQTVKGVGYKFRVRV